MNQPKYGTVAAIVLAAGRGSRLAGPLPKPLLRLGGQTLLGHILKNLKAIPIYEKIVVIGHQGGLIQQEFGRSWKYAKQKRPQGNGHAAQIGLSAVSKRITTVLFLHADSAALYPARYLRSLIRKHRHSKAVISVLTKSTSFFQGTGGIVMTGGRYVSVEAMQHQLAKKVKRINLGIYLARVSWLRKTLSQLRPSYDTHEYMLSDIISLAPKERVQILTLRNRHYCININTWADLRQAQHSLAKG